MFRFIFVSALLLLLCSCSDGWIECKSVSNTRDGYKGSPKHSENYCLKSEEKAFESKRSELETAHVYVCKKIRIKEITDDKNNISIVAELSGTKDQGIVMMTFTPDAENMVTWKPLE